MFRPKTKHFIVLAVLVLAMGLGVSQSQAFGWHGGWGGCGWGCYEPWGGYYGWYGGCGWGYCGRPVVLSRWYTPCWGCCDTCCDSSWGYTDSCCGASVATPTQGGAAPALAPTPAPAPAPAPAAPPAGMTPPVPGASTEFSPLRATSGVLTVYVPADAKVTVNGLATKSAGSKREYVSYNLQPGLTYKYQVTAQIVRDGKVLEDTKEVTLTAGGRDGVAFGFNAKPDEQLAQTF